MFHTLSAIFFPASCLCCGKRTATKYLCEKCEKHLPKINKQICPVCQKRETQSGEVCMHCYGEMPIEGVFSALSYRDPVVKSCIETLKYRFVSTLSEPLGRTLASSIEHSSVPLPDIIIPVPLHPFRYRWRGFNQAELIAREVQHHLVPLGNIPLSTTILIRNRLTKPQAKTKSREKRLASLRNAFSLSENTKTLVYNKRIWLVDDVSTTNATFFECAKPLKVAGAKEIWGIAVAR